MAATRVVANTENLSWYERNQKEIAHAVMLTGLALTMIGLGALATSFTLYDAPHMPYLVPDDWPHYQDYYDVDTLLQLAPEVAFFSEVAIIVGILLMLGGGLMLDNASKKAGLRTKDVEKITKETASKEAKRQSRKNIALIVGFAMAMFGVGMMVSSSLFLNNVVSHLKDILDRATSEGWGWPHQDYWQAIKADWLDPAEWRLPLMVTGGVFTIIGGGGIIASACGYSLCHRCSKTSSKSLEEKDVDSETF